MCRVFYKESEFQHFKMATGHEIEESRFLSCKSHENWKKKIRLALFDFKFVSFCCSFVNIFRTDEKSVMQFILWS